MRRGVWHQFGDRSQKLALEQLEDGNGVGVVISPRDLTLEKAKEYAPRYVSHGAEVLVDPQFFLPEASVGKLMDWPTKDHRASVSALNAINDQELETLASILEQTNRDLGASAVISPAVLYKGGRSDVEDLNERLFRAAKMAADAIGIPVLGSVVLERSATSSLSTLETSLSAATSLSADGWYYAFEFNPCRIPNDQDEVYRFCYGALKLACSGKPVLHGYVGPVGVLSLATGATGVGIGHSQNLWGFCPERWQPSTGTGGGGAAPPRFFSPELWGTIVYPDEFTRIAPNILSNAVNQTRYSGQVSISAPFLSWSRWDANKHLVAAIGSTLTSLGRKPSIRARLTDVRHHLQVAADMHSQILQFGVELADGTANYQLPWDDVLARVELENEGDLDLIELMA